MSNAHPPHGSAAALSDPTHEGSGGPGRAVPRGAGGSTAGGCLLSLDDASNAQTHCGPVGTGAGYLHHKIISLCLKAPSTAQTRTAGFSKPNRRGHGPGQASGGSSIPGAGTVPPARSTAEVFTLSNWW